MESSTGVPHIAASQQDEGANSSSDLSLEIDSDRDSAYSASQSLYTTSATSSVYNFRYENGRRYHAYAEGQYLVPNDELEADRLDLQHQAFRLSLDGKLFRAPLPSTIHSVLDVGCGTGIWAIEFADQHPSTSVLGTDLSPIQPESVPPNVEFLIDDCEKDWLFRSPFDYIHTRAMVAAVKDWPRFFAQAYANLSPGGYLECQEISFPIRCMDAGVTAATSPLVRWSELFIEAARKTGLDAASPRGFAPMLREAGFVGVNVKTFKWPLGMWAKGAKFKFLGRFVYEDLMDWLPSSSLGLFTKILQWSREEVEVFLAECRQEAKRKDRHYYAECYFWYARRPTDASSNERSSDPIQDEEILEPDEEPEDHNHPSATQPANHTSIDPEGPAVAPSTDGRNSSAEKEDAGGLSTKAEASEVPSSSDVTRVLIDRPASSATKSGKDNAPGQSLEKPGPVSKSSEL